MTAPVEPIPRPQRSPRQQGEEAVSNTEQPVAQPLDDTQRSRVVALGAARDVLVIFGRPENKREVGELIVCAEYILKGTDDDRTPPRPPGGKSLGTATVTISPKLDEDALVSCINRAQQVMQNVASQYQPTAADIERINRRMHFEGGRI